MMTKPMKKFHAKAIAALVGEYVTTELPNFKKDVNVSKAYGLTNKNLSFSAIFHDKWCAFFIRPALVGTEDPWFEFYLAWGDSPSDLYAAAANPRHHPPSVVNKSDGIALECLIDPEVKKTFHFGSYYFDTEAMSFEDYVKNNCIMPSDMESAKKDVAPVVSQAMHDLKNFAIPFFSNLSNYIGKSYIDVGQELRSQKTD